MLLSTNDWIIAGGYDDMSRKQLASMIARLEIKMDNQKQATMGDNSSVSSFSSKKGKTDTEGESKGK